jgi:hypothetical protein
MQEKSETGISGKHCKINDQMMIPLQWSISCWMISATQPENLLHFLFQLIS